MLYLFEEDYEAKLKKANTNGEGLINLQKIGDFLGAERTEMNSVYKNNIADKLNLLFKIKMTDRIPDSPPVIAQP